MELPSIVFRQNDISQFEQAIKKEWLITNGLGGYASSTVLGLNTRKYHALLVAALHPPGDRTVILSKLDEDIDVDGKIYQLGANDFRHDIYPQGYKYLTQFQVSPLPIYIYRAGEVEIEKSLVLPYAKNAVIAHYHVTNSSQTDAAIKVYPLLSYRHYHYSINRKEKPVLFDQNATENTLELTFKDPPACVAIKAVGGSFMQRPVWADGVFYREEENRGESSSDESYIPGFFEFHAPKNTTANFAIATAVNSSMQETQTTLAEFGSDVASIQKVFSEELERRRKMLGSVYSSLGEFKATDGLNWLLQAANDFNVSGDKDKRFIIAGYQWFGSWGRDSFISLPGLLLATAKFEDARSVILDYTHYCRQGLVPNLIDDKTGEPLYNTVDGTLWYVNSILQYVKYTGGYEFVAKALWGTLKDIFENHKRGTLNGIHVDNDGLLAHGPQLTWMDAVVGESPVTPRGGKAVEVQALWYNALRAMQLFALKYHEKQAAEDYAEMAEQARESFCEKFWNPKSNSLYDLIDDAGDADWSTRPNQVIAGALDFSIIDKEKIGQVVDFVQSELLTPVGLRTLSPKDPRYRGRYEGGREARDQAYHCGTVWPWLTGPFTTAYLRAKGYADFNRESAYRTFIEPLFDAELSRGGLGTINEIYDGDSPFLPRGCIAQAWSVAEPLRAYIEDVLMIRPKYEKQTVLDLSVQTQ
ncbi:MAG: glycogen debranching enzyme N-terminal domain-containing protein [Candidatus Bathyarchaeota archaeon]|nr:glycogen debranching enzyme N-terminal domain-containing protein [Candidatus Bathyarchaeota archaeon]